MPDADSTVTDWLERLQCGDAGVSQQLWDRYFQQLVDLARQRLRQGPRILDDEEDLALSAFDSFFRAASSCRWSARPVSPGFSASGDAARWRR